MKFVVIESNRTFEFVKDAQQKLQDGKSIKINQTALAQLADSGRSPT